MGVVKESGEFSRLKQGHGYPGQKTAKGLSNPKMAVRPTYPYTPCTIVAPYISMKAVVC